MTENRKKVALIIVHRIIDETSVGVNSSKVKHERTIGKVMSTKTIRNK